MFDRELKSESLHGSESSLPSDLDDISTVALSPDAPPPTGEKPRQGSGINATGSDRSSGSSVKSAIVVGEESGTPAGMPTDKTVISKRVPSDNPLPPLPTPQSLGQALIGKTLDHYELVEFVGGGGMGAVFRSIDTRLGRTVAVKVLSRDHTDEETIKRFRNEAQSAARLDHPNIARVYFVGEAEGWNYIVFEYIEGTNLRDIVDSHGPLPLEDALDYTMQVAAALDHASNRDVVHRDIKPSNVLITPTGQAKLVDMGLARLHQVESSSEDLTASGVMLGTFDYISPEQARDPRSADVRSDIYSLGCTLYFMLAGRPPFPEGTAVQKLLKHNSEEPPDLRLFRPELPPPATALVGRMLAKRPSQRQQSPQELIAEVHALAHQLGLGRLTEKSGVAVTVAPPQGSYWSRLMPIAVPIAALVLLLWLIDSLSRQGERPLEIAQQPKLQAPTASPPSDTSVDDSASAGAKGSAAAGSQGKTPAESTTGNDAVSSTKATGSENAAGNKTDHPAVTDSGNSDVTSSSTGGATTPGGIANTDAGNSSQGAGETARQITRIIVRKDQSGASVPADAEVVHSLAQACLVAAKEQIVNIELEFDGELVEQPFPMTASNVKIAAAENPARPGSRYRPVIVFRPRPSPTDSDRQMIRLSGGSRSQVTFQGVELRLELPDAPASGWSVLALYQLQSLYLIDSVLTVKCPGGTQGVVGYEPVAMLALQPYRPAEMMKMTDDMMASLPSIVVQLDNCVARGEANFLTAAEERPLKVTWKQGLLVTPLRLLDTGGSILPKPTQQDKFEIMLDHVTAIVAAGLVRQERKNNMAVQRLDVRCYNSVLVTDPDSFQFEFAGLIAKEDLNFDFDGNENLYPPRNGKFLRVGWTGGTDEYPTLRDWGRGRDSGDGRGLWISPPPTLAEIPAHEHIPAFYQLDLAASEEGGFDQAILRAVLDAPASSTTPVPDAIGTEADFFDRPDSP